MRGTASRLLIPAVQTVFEIGANAVTAVGGVFKLINGLKALNATLHLTKAAAGWISLALTAAASAVIWFMSRTDDATDSLMRLTTAEEDAARAAERAKEAEESGTEAHVAAAGAIGNHIEKIEHFKGSKQEEKKFVKELNATYGNTMGYFKSLSQWYNALTKNSKAYCKQLEIEAKTRIYSNEIASLEREMDKIAYDGEAKKENLIKYSKTRDRQNRYMSAEEAQQERAKGNKVAQGVFKDGTTWYYGETDIIGSSEHEKAQAAYDNRKRRVEELRKEREKLISSIPEMELKGEEKEPDLDPKDTKQTTRLQEINKQLAQYQESYATASESQKEQIRVKVAALTKEKDAIEMAKAELERPLKLDSLDAYNKEIAYQTKLRQTASAEQIVEIDRTITQLTQERTAYELSGRTALTSIEDYEKEQSRLQAMMKTANVEQLVQIQERYDKVTEEKELFERSAKIRISAEKITSYKELEEQISLCNEMLRTGTEEERRYAEANLPALKQKEKIMSSRIAAIGVAERPEDAGNLEEIGAAISLLDDKIQRASSDEVEALTRTKMAFEKKKEAYERGIRIPEMQKEVEDLQKLPDRVLKVKVESMGFEGLSEKLREIQKQLDDLDNPPTAGQRKALEELKSVYEQWRSECVLSFSTIQSGWSGIKGIGNGFESLTSAVQESSNAWQMITGVVDGFIQISNGIMAVLEIMEMIGIISKANAAAKTAEAVATTVSTTATVADAVATDAAVVAEVPAIAANKALTASYLELAASEYMAAHAYIPFAGFGIASGFTTAATTMVKSIGATAFADGGMVYGPTLGLVGEYAGASSNPEVIAPLKVAWITITSLVTRAQRPKRRRC